MTIRPLYSLTQEEVRDMAREAAGCGEGANNHPFKEDPRRAAWYAHAYAQHEQELQAAGEE